MFERFSGIRELRLTKGEDGLTIIIVCACELNGETNSHVESRSVSQSTPNLCPPPLLFFLLLGSESPYPNVRTSNPVELVLFTRSASLMQPLCNTRQYEIDFRKNLRRWPQCFTRGQLRGHRITSRRYCTFPFSDFFFHAPLRARETPNFWSLTQPTFRFGVLDEKGPRRTMEDAHSYVFNYDGVHGQGFFAVFDGHAGKEAADWCGKNFHQVSTESLHSTMFVMSLL